MATTVYVVTAGREATYRIERIYLAQDEAQDFADRYNADLLAAGPAGFS